MTTANPTTAPLLDYLQHHQAAALDRLRALLAIPSVSTDPAYQLHVEQAAAHVAQTLRDLNLDVTVHRTPGHPIVLAHSRPDDAPADAPHVLFYGHYDVQPPDPIELWTTPPFEPTIRDGAIVARGACDDKGQISCFFEALRAWRHAGPGGRLPVRVSVLIEGEEECGSVHLTDFLKQHADELKADLVLISDTNMWDRQTPAITYGLRGLLYFDVQLHNADRDLHSGMFGGVLANPANELTRVLGRLFDDQHRVTIPGFYDDVLPVSADEREQWARLGFDEFAHCLTPVGVDVPFGEAGYSTLERKWARPSCDINGLYGGYGGQGAKTVIASYAGAKVSFRLAPRQNAASIAAAFESWLRSHDVHGCRWKISSFGQAEPVVLPIDSQYVAAAQRACQESAGKAPVLIREGATIPVVSLFKSELGMDSLMLGFGLVDDRIHSPNEKFELACFHLGCRTHALLLAQLAALGRP